MTGLESYSDDSPHRFEQSWNPKKDDENITLVE